MTKTTLETIVKEKSFFSFSGKAMATIVGRGVLMACGAMWYNFLFYNNQVSYSSERGLSASKATFLTGGHTKVDIDKGGKVTVYRQLSFFGKDETFRDDNGDGRVDVYSEGSETFVRKIDGQRFPLVFEQADKNYAVQMARFKPLIDKYIR